jgi:hypothetical protein
MEEQQKVQKEFVESVISKLENKDFGLYFFTMDTRGNATAGIANIYEHVKLLTELGFNAYILHEKTDYKLRGDVEGPGLADWLGEEYANLPHLCIENKDIKIKAEDFLIVPEIFANVMDQAKKFPCKKIVLSQNYDYLLELLPLGRRWTDYGFNDVITTSQKQANYISSLFPSTRSKVVPISIPTYFKPSDKPKIPVIAISAREQGVAAKIAKMFYLQYPLYKWVTFKELRGLSRTQFAEELGKCCLGVWLDDVSSFGTFPLEAMQCDTPVIGKMPNMIPEWMEQIDESGNSVVKNNGVWVNTHLTIPELIATYLKVWLEDSVPQDLIDGIEASKNLYTSENQMKKVEEVYTSLISDRISELNNTIKTLEEQK